MKKIILITALLITVHYSWAQIRLASIFGNDMVLQQQADVPLWGWANPTQEVTVKGSWDNIEVKTVTDHNARWKVTLKTPAAGGPYTVSFRTNYEVTLQNVMIGEVWLCSGQSNMEWSMSASTDGTAEAPSANYPGIRLFLIGRSAAESPQLRGEGKWQVCTPESVRAFSAVGYFFGKKLHADLNIPIGLIAASWGGTPAEAWTPDSLITADPELNASSLKLPQQRWGAKEPGHIFNSMIYPFVPFPIAGVIWYQGEANTPAPATYKKLMETMINGWRAVFNKQFPFYYVQIAPYAYGKPFEGTLIREQQAKMVSIPNTGMAVISDAVENVNDIHPKNKKPVGERLANYALAETYGRTGLFYKTPLYKSMRVEKGQIIVTFDNCPNGLISRGGEPSEFMIAGDDKKFVPAKARISGNTVIVSAKEVKEPIAVRFGWDNTSIPNLFSKEGLPVSCFRTDDWPVTP